MHGVRSEPSYLAGLRSACRSCALGELCLPAGIEQADLADLARLIEPSRSFDTGRALFRAGERARALYVVGSGTFKTTLLDSAGGLQVLGFHLPGELIGLDGLSEDCHACDAVALERSRVCALPFERLDYFAERIGGLHRQLMRIVSREAVTDHVHLVVMGKRQADARIAGFLADWSDRHRRLHRDPDLLHLPMSRTDLASYLGLVVETVSRLLTRMQQAGVLRVTRRTVQILDQAALRTIAREELCAGHA